MATADLNMATAGDCFMAKLTKRFVESLDLQDSDFIVWDDALTEFGIRVWPTDRRVYFVRYRTKNRVRRYKTLGVHGKITAEQARSMAVQYFGRVHQGDDPVGEQKAMSKSPTVAELAKRYMEEHALVKKKPGSARPDEYNLRLHVLPTLGNRKVADVTRVDIAELHNNMSETPGAANRVLALLSKMFTLAEIWGLRPEGTNPVRHIQRFRERRFERFLSSEELARLGHVLFEAERTQTEYPSVIAAIRLLIFTGARLSEILELKWEQVDLENSCLRLPDSKTGAKIIHLPSPALDILDQIERHESNAFVIVGQESCSHLVNLRKPWHRIRKQAGLDDVRLHDLRHSFASIGANIGLSLPMIGKMLGHNHAATTQRYAHLAADPVKEAVDKIGVTIAAALRGNGQSNSSKQE
jgi:integrase